MLMFLCPGCGTRHSGQLKNGLWRCTNCEASLVTFGFLSQLTGKGHVDVLRSALEKGKVGTRRCPVCVRPMSTFLSPTSAQHTVLDGCTSCRLVCYDAGELNQTVSRTSARETSAKTHAVARRMETEALDFIIDGSPAVNDMVLALANLPQLEEGPAIRQASLVTAVTCVFIALTAIGGFRHFASTLASYGFIPASAFRNHGLTLLAHVAIHAGWAHLLGNLYFLFLFGDATESLLGARRTLELFLWTALGGALGPLFLDGHSTVPHIGASGLVMGIATYFVLRFPRAKLRWFRFWPASSLLLSFRVPAWMFVGSLLVVNTLSVPAELAGQADISFLAHLGGAAAGALYFLFSR